MTFVSPITEPLKAQILAMAERGVHHTRLAELVREATGRDYSDGSMRNWLARERKAKGIKGKPGRPRKEATAPPPPQAACEAVAGQAVTVLATTLAVQPASETAREALAELALISAQCRDLAARDRTPESERVPLLELAATTAIQRHTLAAEFIPVEERITGAGEPRH